MPATFLVLWNPNRWEWGNLPNYANGLEREITWSCGNTKKISKGDRIFMVHLGQEPRGIFASGKALSKPYKNGRRSKTPRSIDMELDRFIDPGKNEILDREKLIRMVSHNYPSVERPWTFRGGGVEIPPTIAVKLEKVWQDFLSKANGPEKYAPSQKTTEEFDKEQADRESQAEKLSDEALQKKALAASSKCPVSEGRAKQFARNPYVAAYAKRRTKGICQLCSSPAPFNNKANNPHLETHHIIWLSKGGEDSIQNTVALCPNCHRKMHILNVESDQDILRGRISSKAL